MKTKVDYYVKYKWYGYEGVGWCNNMYSDEDILNVIKFIEDPIFRQDEIDSIDRNGFTESFENIIYKRTEIIEKCDMKQELRNLKIKKIIE
jgi:hypothetical protein